MRARYHDDKYIGELWARQPILGGGAVFIIIAMVAIMMTQVRAKLLQNRGRQRTTWYST